MSSTRLLIRQTSARRLGGCITGSATSSATGPTGSLTDTNTLLDTGESIYDLIGAYVMFTEGNNAGAERRIASEVPSAGVVAAGNNWSGNIVSGDDYEIQFHLAPSEWNLAINAALRRCTRRREESVTVVSDQNQYSLAALTDLTTPRQIMGIYKQQGDTGQKQRKLLHTQRDYEIWDDDNVLTINLFNALQADTDNNLEILVVYLAPYAALSTDAATTNCDLDWITTGTLLQALEWYPQRLEEAAKKTLQMSVSDFRKEFARLSMLNAPDRAKEIGVRFV